MLRGLTDRPAARLLPAVLALPFVLGLAGCSSAGVSSADLYKIGCPAIDSVAGGGTAANKATVAGLKKLRDSGQLGPEAQHWVENAITALASAKPQDLPSDARQVVVDGCAQNGYPLRNLR